MIKVLITGANSYIGTSFEKYASGHYPEDFDIDTIDMIDGSWRETGKGLGKAFKGLAKSIVDSAEEGIDKLDGDDKKEEK